MLHFDYNEFDSPDHPNSGINMDSKFLEMLDDARAIAGIPFKINSGYRTKLHNEKVGGKKNSSHLNGFAADISVTNSLDRFTILDSLIESGFNRIGIGSTFIHVDFDLSKSPYVIWTY